MSRASRRDNSTAPTMFPFLAVLLCTMGVLVVLLMVMASVQISQAQLKQRDEFVKQRSTYDSLEQQRRRIELATLNERMAQLEDARTAAKDRLESEQQRLSQVEENIRRRQEKLALLRVEIAEMHALEDGGRDDLQQARESLERQQQLLARERAEVERLKDESKGRDQYYAIVPYEGSGGTRRKPIYIECRQDTVVFQPSGIELTAADFNDALGSGAPLPSAIRAAQRYYLDQGLIDAEQPYPLILARPDAAATFFRVLSSVTDSGLEFGYEVIDNDWDLDFSAADPAVSEEMARAIDNARSRIAALRETAPGTFAASQLNSFDPGPSLLERVRRGQLPVGYTSMGTSSGSPGSSGVVLNSNRIDMSRLAAALNAAAQGEAGRRRSSRPGSSVSQVEATSAAAPGSTAPPLGGEDQGGQDTPAAQADAASASALVATPGEGPPVAGTNAPAAAGTTAEVDPFTATSMEAPQGGNVGDATGNTPSQMSSATAYDEPGKAPKAAPGAGPQSRGMALVRTIRVQVAADHLVVRSGKRARLSDRVIPLDGGVQQAAKKFVRAVQAQVSEWGIAGDGFFWRPVMEIEVMPGGEQLAGNLADVLRQGGLEVRVARLPESDRANN